MMVEMTMERQCCEKFQKVRGEQLNVGRLCLVEPFKKTHSTSAVDNVREPRSAAGTQLWPSVGPPSTVSLSHHELQTHLLLKPHFVT